MLKQRLERSTDRVVGGVCAGIAEFFGWQSISIRTLFALVAILGLGSPFLVYLVLWWMMPPPSDSAFRLDDYRAE